MLSKRAIALCKIILQLIITKKMYAIIGGLRSGGLKSGGPIFGGLKSGGLMSGGLKSAHRRIECRSYRDVVANSILPAQCVRFKKNVDTKILINPIDFCTRR